jgi:hypothetical protein
MTRPCSEPGHPPRASASRREVLRTSGLIAAAAVLTSSQGLLARHFRGQPFVGREAPVSSVDPAVTHGVVERGL